MLQRSKEFLIWELSTVQLIHQYQKTGRLPPMNPMKEKGTVPKEEEEKEGETAATAAAVTRQYLSDRSHDEIRKTGKLRKEEVEQITIEEVIEEIEEEHANEEAQILSHLNTSHHPSSNQANHQTTSNLMNTTISSTSSTVKSAGVKSSSPPSPPPSSSSSSMTEKDSTTTTTSSAASSSPKIAFSPRKSSQTVRSSDDNATSLISFES